MSRLGIFRIDGTEYDLDDLTLDEMAEIEELAGAAFSEVNYGSAKGMKAFTYVLVKRTNPDITMDDIGQIKLAAMVAPDERMPPLPPDEGADQVSENGTAQQGDSGVHPSVASTTG